MDSSSYVTLNHITSSVLVYHLVMLEHAHSLTVAIQRRNQLQIHSDVDRVDIQILNRIVITWDEFRSS